MDRRAGTNAGPDDRELGLRAPRGCRGDGKSLHLVWRPGAGQGRHRRPKGNDAAGQQKTRCCDAAKRENRVLRPCYGLQEMKRCYDLLRKTGPSSREQATARLSAVATKLLRPCYDCYEPVVA